MTAWSFSRLTAFETCPKKMYEVIIAKSVREEEGEAASYGKEVHKALELRVSKKKPLPFHLTHLEPTMAKLLTSKGEFLPEQKMALNKNFAPTGWFDNDVWVRAIMDLAIVGNTHAVLVDYKTGKVDPDFTQLRMAGAVFMAYRPEIESVTLAYWFLKAKQMPKQTMHRCDVPVVWNELLPRVKRMDHAFTVSEFPARPSGLCKKHCPVRTCVYHGK